MKLTKDEIEVIKKSADELKKWADNQSYNPPCATKVQLSPSWYYKNEILLLLEKTNIGAKVERDFDALDKLHAEYESWSGKDLTEDNEEEFTILVDSLKGTFYDLADTLWQIAQNAREELDAEKPEERGGNATSAKIINIENFKGVLGGVQAESVQTGDYSSIHKQPITAEKNRGIIRKILKIIGAIIVGIIGSLIAAILIRYFW